LLLHPQPRVERTLRMVFVRHGRAEQREDAVTGRLHDISVVVVHRVDHKLEGRIDDRARRLRINVLDHVHRPLDVREQRRHCLALSLGGLGFRRDPYRRRRLCRRN
jgi:hypothetical protein